MLLDIKTPVYTKASYIHIYFYPNAWEDQRKPLGDTTLGDN